MESRSVEMSYDTTFQKDRIAPRNCTSFVASIMGAGGIDADREKWERVLQAPICQADPKKREQIRLV